MFLISLSRVCANLSGSVLTVAPDKTLFKLAAKSSSILNEACANPDTSVFCVPNTGAIFLIASRTVDLAKAVGFSKTLKLSGFAKPGLKEPDNPCKDKSTLSNFL